MRIFAVADAIRRGKILSIRLWREPVLLTPELGSAATGGSDGSSK